LIPTQDPPYEQRLVGTGASAAPVVVVGGWLLAPGSPCERVLAVMGGGCWVAVSLPHIFAVDTHNPAYEGVLIGVVGSVLHE